MRCAVPADTCAASIMSLKSFRLVIDSAILSVVEEAALQHFVPIFVYLLHLGLMQRRKPSDRNGREEARIRKLHQ